MTENGCQRVCRKDPACREAVYWVTQPSQGRPGQDFNASSSASGGGGGLLDGVFNALGGKRRRRNTDSTLETTLGTCYMMNRSWPALAAQEGASVLRHHCSMLAWVDGWL